MRRAIVVAVSCGSGFSVQFSMFPDALACPLRSQVGMPRLSVVIFFLLESALSFRNPETLCEALLGTCAITRQRFLSPICPNFRQGCIRHMTRRPCCSFA